MRTFESTKPGTAEDRKAYYKNYNLPILNYIYNGSEKKEIFCCISKTPGFKDIWCPVRKQPMQVFRLDFDHIRQAWDPKYKNGTSVDKTEAPSSIFRSCPLDSPKYRFKLIEMMCCWPLSTEEHSYKTNSGKYGDIVLSDYPKKWWPWHLKNEKNFDKVCKKYRLNFLIGHYDFFIEWLCNIEKPCIPKTLPLMLKKVQKDV